jgi:hypothetical protein
MTAQKLLAPSPQDLAMLARREARVTYRSIATEYHGIPRARKGVVGAIEAANGKG